MKFGLKVLGFLIALAVSYALYQSRLGAVPFLAASAVLFYLGYRLMNGSESKQTEEPPPE
ncbi:hypothetical protein ACFSCZ_18750 [Siminovitchia sediminis]|uniref:Uncharacterized protein n=1 Tax=Siminovitchia sediminis TaxID=1274353 RepID=A0ABW4KPH1_9BACI